ncbi:SH3-domain-containing protein [Ceratobasidium sp. AG-I]|nr:SH3-domain-containing protein [Ceratobasidium sp. AG-I]
MSPDPLLAHILTRLEADVRFLADQGHITQADSQTVLGVISRTSPAHTHSVEGITGGMNGMNVRSVTVPTMPAMPTMPAPYGGPISTPSPAPASAAPAYGNASQPSSYGNTAPPAFPGGPPAGAAPYATSVSPSPANSALRRPVPPPPPAPPAGVQAKALWDYNLNGQLADDLTFRSGDIIQIVKEENPDWWTGRINGKEGMFPSNHVEKLPNTPSAAPAYAPTYGYTPEHEKQQHQMYAPPPGPPAPYQQAGPVQPAPPQEEEKKKGKFGKYGGMMAGSAAGGLGFGAGAAVGSGLINAIF